VRSTLSLVLAVDAFLFLGCDLDRAHVDERVTRALAEKRGNGLACGLGAHWPWHCGMDPIERTGWRVEHSMNRKMAIVSAPRDWDTGARCSQERGLSGRPLLRASIENAK
jgi:hypothetical protein